jgi:hypothetical protein
VRDAEREQVTAGWWCRDTRWAVCSEILLPCLASPAANAPGVTHGGGVGGMLVWLLQTYSM